jgi:hypothetical protein
VITPFVFGSDGSAVAEVAAESVERFALGAVGFRRNASRVGTG